MLKLKINVKNLFIFTVVIGLLGAFLSILLSEGHNWKYLVWNGESAGVYPDLYQSLADGVSRKPYDQKAIYPAFAYFVCLIIGKMIPSFDYGDAVVPEFNYDLLAKYSTDKASSIISVYFFAISTAIVLILFYNIMKNEPKVLTYSAICLFVFSAPMMFLIERGNMVIFALIFLMGFLIGYDSENKAIRYVSYICLAIATALKIYPAIFGVLVLKRNRIKEVVSLILLGIAFFAIPFVLFGGISGIFDMFENAFSWNRETQTGATGFGYGFKISISNFISIVDGFLGIKLSNYSGIIAIGVMALTVVSSFALDEKWEKVTCLCIALTFCPVFSWIYNGVYFLAPLAFFLIKHKNSSKLYALLYTVLFIGIFMPFPYRWVFRSLVPNNSATVNPISISTFVCILSMLGFTVILVSKAVKNTVVKLKRDA